MCSKALQTKLKKIEKFKKKKNKKRNQRIHIQVLGGPPQDPPDFPPQPAAASSSYQGLLRHNNHQNKNHRCHNNHPHRHNKHPKSGQIEPSGCTDRQCWFHLNCPCLESKRLHSTSVFQCPSRNTWFCCCTPVEENDNAKKISSS